MIQFFGILSIILFLVVNSPFMKLILAILYILATFINGGRIKLLPNIILFLSITIISIFDPVGLVLFQIGFVKVTKGALLSGVEKSSILIGLLYLSRFITFTSVKFKGNFGVIIRDTFFYFNQLTNGERVTFKNFLGQIDDKLLKLEEYNIDSKSSITNKNNRALIFIFIISILGALLDIMLL